MIGKALAAARRMRLDVVPKGVLDAAELRRVLREVRRDDALLALEGSNPDLAIAIIERSLALRVPASSGRRSGSAMAASCHMGPTTTRRESRPLHSSPRFSGVPGLETCPSRRRENRARGEPQDCGTSWPHRPRKILLRADTFRR